MSSFFPTLAIDLSALCSNYRLLKAKHARHAVGAVVKANAYGLGMDAVSRALWQEGCREFFVATLEEGIELRAILPEAWIAVFNGPFAGEEKEYRAQRLTPVLNEPGQVERFAQAVDGGRWMVDGQNKNRGAVLHVDTGMTRLGLNETQLHRLATIHHSPSTIHLLMSHLACADDPAHPKNAEQLSRFKAVLNLFPGARASLANSAALFLAPEFHFDLARPGCALYGINPTEGANPMRHVATLSAPILQVRTLDRDETVGYDATAQAKKGSRLALIGLGYADGYFRHLSNRGFAFIAGHKAPIVGRISMDMLALDVSAVADAELAGARAEFINAAYDVSALADDAGTVGYEVFTRIGQRVQRVYV